MRDVLCCHGDAQEQCKNSTELLFIRELLRAFHYQSGSDKQPHLVATLYVVTIAINSYKL